MTSASLLWALLSASLAATPDGGGGDRRVITGRVTDSTGAPVGGVRVIAVESQGAQVNGAALSEADGTFRLEVPPREHDLSLMTPRWLLTAMKISPGNRVDLHVRRAFPDIEPAACARAAHSSAVAMVQPRGGPSGHGHAVVTTGLAVGTWAGRIVDANGDPVAGVRLLSVEQRSRTITSVTESGAGGRFVLVTTAGLNRVFVCAPGLVLDEGRRQPNGETELRVAVAAAAEEVTVTTGRGRPLRFRMDDSVDPVFVPPPAVALALDHEYLVDMRSFCPGDLRFQGETGRLGSYRTLAPTRGTSTLPASVWARRCKLPRYWWLRLLRETPPPSSQDFRDGPGPAGRDPVPRWWEDVIREMQLAEDPPKK